MQDDPGQGEPRVVSVNVVFTIFTNAFSPIAPSHMRRFRQCRCAAFGAQARSSFPSSPPSDTSFRR